MLYYCLHVFQESRYIDEIVLVTGEREIDYCREKIVQQYGFDKVVQTPDRAYVWQVQTPQVFDAKLVRAAYEKLIQSGWEKATDDAMVVERMTEHPVKLVFGSYENIKITTPEDLEIAGLFIRRSLVDCC